MYIDTSSSGSYRITFRDIGFGKIFKYDKAYFMKIRPIPTKLSGGATFSFNAVNTKYGGYMRFNDFDYVSAIEGRFVVDKEVLYRK